MFISYIDLNCNLLAFHSIVIAQYTSCAYGVCMAFTICKNNFIHYAHTTNWVKFLRVSFDTNQKKRSNRIILLITKKEQRAAYYPEHVSNEKDTAVKKFIFFPFMKKGWNFEIKYRNLCITEQKGSLESDDELTALELSVHI